MRATSLPRSRSEEEADASAPRLAGRVARRLVAEKTIMLDNKPRLVVSPATPPIGADLIRWLYCRQNPAQNINFGPGPAGGTARQVHAQTLEHLRLLLQLRPPRRLRSRQAASAGEGAARHRPLDPVGAAASHSNGPQEFRGRSTSWPFAWKRSSSSTPSSATGTYAAIGRRFWKSEKGPDKQAAYQTLYTVLETLTRLIAPVVPFLSEAMYQNLTDGGADLSADSRCSHRRRAFIICRTLQPMRR